MGNIFLIKQCYDSDEKLPSLCLFGILWLLGIVTVIQQRHNRTTKSPETENHAQPDIIRKSNVINQIIGIQ